MSAQAIVAPREPLHLDLSIKRIAILMADGGHGINYAVAQAILGRPGGITAIMNLDDMNIRGDQLLVAYRVTGGSVDQIIELAQDRDKVFVEKVNEGALLAGINWKAQQTGGAFGIRERFNDALVDDVDDEPEDLPF